VQAVYCEKCKRLLLPGAPAGSMTYCQKCGKWTEQAELKQETLSDGGHEHDRQAG